MKKGKVCQSALDLMENRHVDVHLGSAVFYLMYQKVIVVHNGSVCPLVALCFLMY